jgi:hypothetical protein
MEHKQAKHTAEQVSPNKLNINNFKMTEAMRLKILHRDPLEWHYLHTKFHENRPNSSKVINGGHTDRQPFLNDQCHI